jgi:hypothetical protein
MQLAIQDLHIVDSSGNILLQNAQRAILNNRHDLGVYADLATLQAAYPAPEQQSFAYLYSTGATVRWIGSRWVPSLSRGEIAMLDNTTVQVQSEFDLTDIAFEIVMFVEIAGQRMIKSFHVFDGNVEQGAERGAELTQISMSYNQAASQAAQTTVIDLIGSGSGQAATIKWIAKRIF